MWKTAAYADGKLIHSLWKRTGPFPQPANRFPTATPDQAVYAHSHNACCCEYPSYPFDKIKNKAKKAGIQSSDHTDKLHSRFIYPSGLFILFSSPSGVGITGGKASTSFRSASKLNNVIKFSINASTSLRCSLHQKANKVT